MDAVVPYEQIVKLTGFKRPGQQLRELHKLGFWRARRCRVSGAVVLEVPHYEAVSRGGDIKQNERPRPKLRPVAA
jgi:hypothetical protein